MRFERIFPYGWNPETSTRERHTRIRRRERKLDLERQEREFACHGPLVDIAEPIIGGDDFMHPLKVQATLEIRMRRVHNEGINLALYFAERCWVTQAEYLRMRLHWEELMASVGKPYQLATHSTHVEMAPTTIPLI